MIVGDFPGERDLQMGQPFSGYSGKELVAMLKEAGIVYGGCFTTVALHTRPPKGDIGHFIAQKKKDITPDHRQLRDKMVLPVVVDNLKRLRQEISLCRPNLILALGNVATWLLTGEWGITSWRGSLLECDLELGLPYSPKVIPAYSPELIMRQWSWRQIAVQDFRRAAKEAETQKINSPNYSFVIRPVYSDVVGILHQLYQQVQAVPGRLAVDIETRAGHIACIGLAWSATEALCIPLMCVERPEGYWPLEQETEIVTALYALLTHPNCQVIGQNFTYDAQYFWRHYHFIPNLFRDTMTAQHTLFSNLPKGLDFLSSMYCEFHRYWKDEGKEWSPKVQEEQLWQYNCKDAVITFEVDTAQQAAIDAMGLREVHDFQQKLFWPVLEAMNIGLRVDDNRKYLFAETLKTEIAKRQVLLDFVLEEPLNIRSSPQMQDLFYRRLGQPPVISRKTGSVTCDDEALRKIAEREPLLTQLVKTITEMRSLSVFQSTFIGAPTSSDGRMRCSFNICGTETYRFSSSKDAFGSGLNLQNIPSGGGEAGSELELPNVRSLFVPDPGYTFFDIDLSSADLRIVVWEADEPEMKALLKAGLDPYTEIAKEFYKDPSITKKDPRRQTFKSFAHGTNYLGTAKGLAERLGLGVHEAEQTQKWYFGRFPRIKAWQNQLKDQVVKRRMVQNVFGYRCYFFDRIEGTIFNQAAAWIPQSTVACLINRGMVRIFETLPEVQVLLQVHDSLAGQFPSECEADLVPKIIACAEIELPYAGDPLVIPVGVKLSTKSWGDCV